MEELDRRRWIGTALAAVAGMVVVAVNFADGDVVAGTILLVLFAGLLWWSWPGRSGAHISHAEAQADAGDDDVIVYWRPG